jgi:hypothetical protein
MGVQSQKKNREFLARLLVLLLHLMSPIPRSENRPDRIQQLESGQKDMIALSDGDFAESTRRMSDYINKTHRWIQNMSSIPKPAKGDPADRKDKVNALVARFD